MVTKIQIAGKLKFYSKPYGRQWKWRYQTHGHVMEPELKIPKSLKNVQIIDPLNPGLSEIEQSPKWKPITRHPLLEQFFPAAKISDNPNYQNNPVKVFDRNCKLHAGISQAGLLSKSIAINGLPNRIIGSNKIEGLKDNDELVKDYIRQALAFTARKEVCERLKIPSDVKFMIAREYATPPSEQMRILLDNLIRLSNINLTRINPALITDRILLHQTALSTQIKRGDDNLLFRRNSEFALFSKSKLLPFAKLTDTQETTNHNLEDMYPVFPTVDFKNEHIYVPNENTFGLRGNANNKFGYLHSIFHVNDDQLSDESNTSRMIMFTFAAAVAQSKIMEANGTLELNSDKSLVNPIVVNGISISDSHKLSFVNFQLNTLALHSNKGIKNICHFDMGNELYFNKPTIDVLPYPTHKNIQRMAIRDLDGSYNPNAFNKLQAIIGYGSN